MSNLYTEEQNLYNITISTDGQTIDYTDPTEGPKTIPDITNHANEFLKVNSDSTNIEWTNVNSGNFNVNRVLLGDGTAGAPSLSFQNEANNDSGIYRDAENSVSVSSGGIQRLQISNNGVNVGTVDNPLNVNVNGSLSLVPVTLTTGSYSWNSLTSDAYILNTSGGNIVFNLQLSGSENIGRTIRFYKNNVANQVQFFSSGGTTRLNSPLGTQSQTNGIQFTNVPTGASNLWFFEITRTQAGHYNMVFREYHDGTTLLTFGSTFRAGDGGQGTPSYSFTNSNGTDTGMYYIFDSIDRLRFSTNNTFVSELNASQCFFNTRLLANSNAGTNTTPAFTFHNDSSTTGYSGQRTNPSTDPRLWAIVNGVQATELTPTQFNVGLLDNNNTNLKTLNQNGASNFNTYSIWYSSFIQPQTTTGLGLGTGAYRSIIFDGTNYVATNSTSTAGQTRLAYTTSLTNPTTWTTITNTGLNMNNCGSVAFGNGIYVVIGTVASQTRQCFTSTNLTTWTQVPNTAPWTTIVTLIKCRFINNQFLVLANNSQVFYSSDGITWAIRSINATNYNLNDVVYSPELQMYVFATGQTAVLHFTGTSIGATTTATAVTSGVQAMNTITYSPKLGMFLGPNNAVNTNMIWSKNGTTWNNTTVTATPNNIINSNEIIWVNDFGGMFINCQFNSSNIAVSRDGFN
jgi:hypothetical protein